MVSSLRSFVHTRSTSPSPHHPLFSHKSTCCGTPPSPTTANAQPSLTSALDASRTRALSNCLGELSRRLLSRRCEAILIPTPSRKRQILEHPLIELLSRPMTRFVLPSGLVLFRTTCRSTGSLRSAPTLCSETLTSSLQMNLTQGSPHGPTTAVTTQTLPGPIMIGYVLLRHSFWVPYIA